jgi:hypothetical protein
MNGYDRERGNPFRRGWADRERYGAEYRPARWGGFGGPEGGWNWGGGRSRGPARGRSGPEYDRGVYGGLYPTYGGHPGAQTRGMYYGGRYEAGMYGRGPGSAPSRVYDRGFADEPFLPESAYRRHPELAQPPRGSEPRSRGGDVDAASGAPDDRDVRDAVRHNLFNDTWLRPERIQVAVNDGVVTLTGEVDDYMEARYAWDDAWEVPGVRGVLNQLTVRSVVAGGVKTSEGVAAEGAANPGTGAGRQADRTR